MCFICQIPFLSLIFSLLICWVQNRLKTCFSCLAGKQFSTGIFIYCLELTCSVLALAKCPQDNVMALSLSPLDSSLGSSVLPILASSQLFPVPCVSWLPAELGQLEALSDAWRVGRREKPVYFSPSLSALGIVHSNNCLSSRVPSPTGQALSPGNTVSTLLPI